MREGRFSGPASEIAQRYSESDSFDWPLYRHDIAGSIAHASALSAAGILTADEFEMIARGLRETESEIAAGKFTFTGKYRMPNRALARDHRWVGAIYLNRPFLCVVEGNSVNRRYLQRIELLKSWNSRAALQCALS